MIHSFKMKDNYIVLDVESGSIHVVDEVTHYIITHYEIMDRKNLKQLVLATFPTEVNPEELEESFRDIDDLIKEGKLFFTSSFSPEHVKLKTPEPVVKAMCLNVAHTCNLTCNYCFARQGQFDGEKALMPYAVGKQALDFLIAQSGDRRHLEVDFFGGEPLLNWQVVKELVAYARAQEKPYNKKFRFTLTTNGMLVDDEVIDFANREMYNVVLSLDGRRSVHDRLRKLPNGEGSYDKIVPAFQKFAQKRQGKNYYIRGTYTHFNRDFIEDIQHMLDLGFRELSMEPVVCSPEDPYALREADLPGLFSQYDQLAEKLIKADQAGDPFHFYHFNLDLRHGPCMYKRVKGCGSGTEYLAVTPWGELFPCHQFIGDETFSMGDVWKGITKPELSEAFSHCNIYENEECRDCWARMYCSGGCAANAYHDTGNIRGIYRFGCELFKKRIECAIMVQVAKLMEAEDVLKD